MFRCPGQDQRFWKPEDIFEVQCPGCGKTIEFFKDEPKLKCRKCGQMVINPKIDLGCAEWCQYAEQCMGVDIVKNLKIMREKLINQMKKVFGNDQKRIEHALAVLDYAEQIQNVEGGDPLIVRAAAILHDIGIHQAEKKYNSPAGKYQEIEGPPIAREILEKYDIPADAIEHICKIIANHHSAKEIDTIEFRIVWDADQIVNLSADSNWISNEKLQDIIDKKFKTDEGRRIASELFVTS
jgi:putative nucleotidyltransferase with HDIG domain